jgi:cob(I)alamin adenosyltransferase
MWPSLAEAHRKDLIENADLVTEMTLVRHPFREQGVKAQAGVEY